MEGHEEVLIAKLGNGYLQHTDIRIFDMFLTEIFMSLRNAPKLVQISLHSRRMKRPSRR